MSSQVDLAYAAFEKICICSAEDRNNLHSEEDAKIQLINRVLFEVLGWDHSDVAAEKPNPNGYSDYLISLHGTASILVEAKRTGVIEIGGAPTNKMKQVKLSGPTLRAAKASLIQAANYASSSGIQTTVLTDGVIWIVYCSYLSGRSYMDASSFVFENHDAIKHDFAVFFDLLSRQGFGESRFKTLFGQLHNNALSQELVLRAAISESDTFLQTKDKLAYDLEIVLERYFSQMSGEGSNEMLMECFVDSRESRLAEFSLEKIASSILGDITTPERGVGSGLIQTISTTLATDVTSTVVGNSIYIVGPTGTGKSTFLDRFFLKILPREIAAHCLVLKVDCLDASGNFDVAIGWVQDCIIRDIERQVFSGSDPTYEELQGLYFSEYNRLRTGPDKFLYESDKIKFKIKFGDFMNFKMLQDKEDYLKKLLYNIVHNLKKLPIFIVDNTDEFDMSYKTKIIQYFHSLKRTIKYCILIFPITDKSAWSIAATDFFTLYPSTSFFLPTPSPREVFRKRIEYMKSKIDIPGNVDVGRYLSAQGIQVKINNLQKFAQIVEDVFVNTEMHAKIVGELANYNLRTTLKLSRRVLVSSAARVETLISAYATGTNPIPSVDDLISGLMRGDYAVYKPSDIPEIYPIFKTDGRIRQSPLLNLRVLAVLHSVFNDATDLETKHASVLDLQGFFSSLGCSETALDAALLELMKASLIEPFDTSKRDISQGQKLAITNRGKRHLILATESTVFFEQMALTTPIRAETVSMQIHECYTSPQHQKEKVKQICGIFAKYLLDQDEIELPNRNLTSSFGKQDLLLTAITSFLPRAEVSRDKKKPLNLGPSVSSNLEAQLAIVEWFDAAKGYGVVTIDAIDGQVRLNENILTSAGESVLRSGDQILCDVVWRDHGPVVTKIHASERFQSDLTSGEGTIVGVRFDRGFGFVKVDGLSEPTYFHFSILSSEEKKRLNEGDHVRVEIAKDRKGTQVRRFLSIETRKGQMN